MLKIYRCSILLFLFCLIACQQKTDGKQVPTSKDTVATKPLASWNKGDVKKQILRFVKRRVPRIPVEDRIAVFDMDGTLCCEAPLWFEMYCAVAKMNDQLSVNPSLKEDKAYQYAEILYKDPGNKQVEQEWVSRNGNYIDSIVWKAFEGQYYEDFVQFCTNYLTTAKNEEKDMILGDMFYQPMLELLDLLLENKFQIYVVSGSTHGVIWSIIPYKTPLKSRDQFIGNRQIITPEYFEGKTHFKIEKGLYTPKNNHDGKAENIYARIGKIPVFAFGNTTGDFDMIQMAVNNEYKGIGFMLNHDDEREYIYPPYHGKAEPGWRKELDSIGGVVVSMKEDFEKVWEVGK